MNVEGRINTFKYFFKVLPIVFILASCVNSATKYYNKAVKKQALGENDAAIELYKLSLAKGGNRARLNYLIAENYRITNRIMESAPYYADAIKSKSKEDRAVYYYAQALKAIGNYQDARINFEKYAKRGLNKVLVRQADFEAYALKQIYSLLNKETFYHVKNAGQFINTTGPEYAPIVGKEGEIIYTASNNQFEYKATGTGFTDIYVFKPDGALEGSGTKKSYDDLINNNKTHEACPAISPDGSFVIFARSNEGSRKGAVDTDLFICEMRDGEWTAPQVMEISDSRAWESTPALSPDGKTLYFSSNKIGGQGGNDIYKSILTDSGWSKPKNMGPRINTPGNEMFPYVRKDGKFFFASDGHIGMGGLDIFVVLNDSTRFDSTSSEDGIINLGPPVNTSSDDFGISYKDDMKGGYFSSNRAGGAGDDDIYEFWLSDTPWRPILNRLMAYLDVKVMSKSESENEKGTAMDSARVQLVFESGEAFRDSSTNKEGKVRFSIDTNAVYNILAEKQGYFSNNVVFKTAGAAYRDDVVSTELINRYYSATVEIPKIEVGKEIVLQNILYDYNKADIRPDAEPDLLLLVDFMEKNPDVIVELGSHTDSRGNDDYNMRLSRARAQSAVDYIVEKGIDPERIKAVGYGETKHVIENAQTEEEHQKNRRTEFRIISMKN